jgi:uncharacterized protein YjbI with pentapeptide repeats
MIVIKNRHTGKRLLRLRQEALYFADLQGLDLRSADLAFQAFNQSNLNNANLTDASLVHATLVAATLRGARLERALLSGSNLATADMTQAILSNADLKGAYLFKADMTGAVLTDAALAGAELKHAKLVNADLTRANLTDASLIGANLTGAVLTGTVFTGAHFDNRTRWPANFEPEQHGAIRLAKAMLQTAAVESRVRLVAASAGEGKNASAIAPGLSKLGGYPDWIQDKGAPRCPGCGEAMDFVAQIDSIGCINKRAELAASGAYTFGDRGMIYVFFCGDCNDVKAILQSH